MSSVTKISPTGSAAVAVGCSLGSMSTCERRAGKWQQSAVRDASRCESVVPAAPAFTRLPLPWMRSEPKTSADGDVALARALQMSRFAASAGTVEAICAAPTAPTLEKFVSDR